MGVAAPGAASLLGPSGPRWAKGLSSIERRHEGNAPPSLRFRAKDAPTGTSPIQSQQFQHSEVASDRYKCATWRRQTKRPNIYASQPPATCAQPALATRDSKRCFSELL